MRKLILGGLAVFTLCLLAGASPDPRTNEGACDLSCTMSGWWCAACEKAFECDQACEGLCPDCAGVVESCEICVKRVPCDGGLERSDVARVIYKCDSCGALGDSEGSCVACDGCGRTVRTCAKAGTAPHVPPTIGN